MSDNGESSREPQVAVSEGGESAAPASTGTTSRPAGSGKVQRRSLPRSTRDTHWASGSGIEPAMAQPPDDPKNVQAAAAEGVATPGGALPHRGQLESAFGLDLSGIVAHTGPEAQATSRAMGANAYATGHHVVLPQGAGVGLAAHEVTHVLQQEQGVHLSGGVDGGASDPLEQQADAIGAAVERGESVAHHFSSPAAVSGAPGAHVQRDSKNKPAEKELSADEKKALVDRARIDRATTGAALASKRWTEKFPALFAGLATPLELPIPRFRQDVYNLIAVDQTDVSPIESVLAAPGREEYAKALAAARQDFAMDQPYLGHIMASIDDLCRGGQIGRNRTRLIAHHSLLRPAGKRAVEEVAALGTRKLYDYLEGPAKEHGRLEDEHLGARVRGINAPTTTAALEGQGSTYRPQAVRQLYDMLRHGALPLEAGGAPAPVADKPAEVSPDLQLKVDALRTAIDKALAAVVVGSDGAPVLPFGDLTLLQGAMDTAGPEACEIVHADKALMARLATAVDPTSAKKILDKLDPVERLHEDCKKAKKTSEEEDVSKRVAVARFSGVWNEGMRELFAFKANSPVFQALRDWLKARSGKHQTALRQRVQDHTRLKDDFIDRLPPDENRVIYRLIHRGTETPTAEDKVHEAAEKKQGVKMVLALRELAGSDPQRLKALEKDQVFRAAASTLNELVALPDGQLVRPWHVCMVMWGLEPGNTQDSDPNTAKLSEVNATGDNNALDINERMKLEGDLLEPCLKELNDELTGKNSDQRYTYRGTEKMNRDPQRVMYGKKGDPQAVSNILVNYDRKAAQPDFVKLLQREHLVFGREISRRYQERHNVDLRTWIYENSGPVNRSGANRVLGNEQGASVGMFNGKMMMAGEMDVAGKMTLAQALREHIWPPGPNGRPIYEWASVSSRAIAANLGNKDKLLEEWVAFKAAVDGTAPEMKTATGINVRAIDLLRNAYMEHSGHFVTHLEAKYAKKPDHLTEIKNALGLTADVDIPADAPPPSVAEQAERMYGKQAKKLWDGLQGLNQYSPENVYASVGVMMHARNLPRVPDDPNDPALPAPAQGENGYTVEERPPRSFGGYYRIHYGTSPELHAAAILRAIPEPRMIPADKAALTLGIDPKMVTGPWVAPAEKATIGPHNRHLVRASFTMEKAAATAAEIWKILNSSGRMDLIQTALAEYNEGEQALIRAEFRSLTGGFDLSFYVRQMMQAREHQKDVLSGKSKEISITSVVSGVNASSIELAGGQWAYQVNVGTRLTEKGDDLLGMNKFGGIQSRSTDAELEQMLSVATTGNMDVKARLRGAVKRDSWSEIKTIVDELTVEERKLVLQDGALMNSIFACLEQFDDERVYKILTGQGDLADRLYSRSHGGSWSERKLWGGTDEAGMRRDIKLYIRQMRLKHNENVRGQISRMMAQNPGSPPPPQETIDKEVNRRVAEACLKLASNESVKAILRSELDKDELAEMESMILNGTGEARDWAVVGGAGKDQILADIRSMSVQERQKRLNDPNYMRLLGQRLREEKDYRDAVNALNEGVGGGGGGLSKLDEASRSSAQTDGSKRDGEKTLDALLALSQAEFEALKGNASLQVQVMAALDAKQQAIARDYLAGPGTKPMKIETAGLVKEEDFARGAGSKGGTVGEPTLGNQPPEPAGVGPDGKPLSPDEAAKRAEARLAAQKEAYVRFIVHQGIHRLGGHLRHRVNWSTVLEAAVEVYKADLPAIGKDRAKDETAPRNVIWTAVKPHMATFAAYHDLPTSSGELTMQPINGAEMTGFVEKAVLGEQDPSDQLIESKILTKKEQDADEERLRRTNPAEAQKRYGLPVQSLTGEFRPTKKDDVAREEDIKNAVAAASDQHVIKSWTTYLHRPPGGDDTHTMKARYEDYRKAFKDAAPVIEARRDQGKAKQKPPEAAPPKPPPTQAAVAPGGSPDAAIDAAAGQAKADAPPPPPPTTALGPLGDKDPLVAKMEEARGRFLEFRVTESAAFEAMLRQFMGDDRDLTAAGTHDPNKPKLSVSKNKRYNTLVEALLARALTLRPETIAALLGMDPHDVWLLQTGLRDEVGQMALSQQKNLRFSGAQRAVGSSSLEEKQALDVTTYMLYRTFAGATSDYRITGEEKEALSYRRSENEAARDSYKVALETAAMWAALIVGVLLTVAATILTGGLALGPVGMMAIGGVTMLLSAHAQAAVKKQYLQEEYDMKDAKDDITKEVMTGLVTMGTSFFAAGLLSTLGKGARLFHQAGAARQVLQKPPSIWGVFLREASEEVASEGMDNVVEAHLAATDPQHWVDGFKVGAKRAREASDAVLSRADDDMMAAAVTSLVTAGVGKMKKGKGKPEFEKPSSGLKREVNLKRNLKMVFGDPEEKFTAAGIEWLMSQAQNGSIDWDNAPEELLKGLLQEYKESVHEVHGHYAHQGRKASKIEKHLAKHGANLQASEVELFKEVNRNVGDTEPFVTAQDFARIRTEVAVAGLQAHEAKHGPLTNPQRDAFIKYVRDAPTTEQLHERSKSNPLEQETVKHADALAKPNTAIGKPIASEETARQVMRDLADGKKEALGRLGLQVPADFDPTKNEWGLGKRTDPATGEVSYVLIKGEMGAVDWSGFPGLEPIAHSHPDLGPDGRQSNHLKKLDQQGGVDVKTLCETDGADRIHFLPSGADLVFLLQRQLKEHTVFTAFQSLGGNRVGNPTPGANNAGINIVIRNPTLYGHLFGVASSPVAEVEIEIWAGNQRLHTMKLWGSDHLGGSHLWHEPPSHMIEPVNLGAGGEAGPGPRHTPSGRRDRDHQGPHLLHPDPNHPSNRQTQEMPAVTPQQDPDHPANRPTQEMQAVTPVEDQKPEVAPRSEYDQATDIWKDDQTSAAELRKQFSEEEWETALGHIREARINPEIGPTIAHIPDHELVSLFLYTDYHYRRWNQALRTNDQDKLREYAARIKAADNALAALPNHEGWVERGTGTTDPSKFDKYQPGTVHTEQAFTSASAGSGNQGGFTGGEFVFRMRSRTGKRIDALAKRGDNETEVLFRPGTRFIVTAREVQDNTTIITMEELEVESTRSGSTAGPTAGGDGGAFRPVENGPQVSRRAQERQAQMDAGDRTRFELIFSQAKNPAQRVMLERALAAGNSIDDIRGLLGAMSDMSEQDIMREFSGAGIVQFYQQSCVPTSYQIALADVDPVYALRLRNNPQMMMQQQREALIAGGGAQTQRDDVRRGRDIPGAVQDQLNYPLARNELDNPANYQTQGSHGGIESTAMVGGALHQQLEQTTGARYDVITNDALNYNTPGQGQFAGGTVPHDRIRAALDAGLPVIFGMMRPSGHANVIIGRDVDPNGGGDIYIISDPMSGTTTRLPASLLEILGVQSITVPRVGDQAPVTRGGRQQQPPGAGGATRAGGRSAGPAVEQIHGFLLELETARDDADRVQAIEKKIRKALPGDFAPDWLEANRSALTSDQLSRLLAVLNASPVVEFDRREAERKQREADEWVRSQHQGEAVDAAKAGTADREQRDLLKREINRQVPDVALTTEVRKGTVEHIISLVVPGGGPYGVKTLNDDLIGPQLTDQLIMPQRNALIERAFRDQGITVVEQTFKQTTLVSSMPAAETQAAIKRALETIDKEMQSILRSAMVAGLREWEKDRDGKRAKGEDTTEAERRIKKIQDLLVTLSGKNFTFDVQVGTAAYAGGKDASYEAILATKMDANKAALMGRTRDQAAKDRGERTTVYSRARFLEFAEETKALLDMLENRSLTIEGVTHRVLDGNRINRDILRDLRKGKIVKSVNDPEYQTLQILKSYFDHVNTLDYIKHQRGDELGQTEAEIKKAQDLIRLLEGNDDIQPGDAEAIAATLSGRHAQAGTASEATFFNDSAKKGDRLIVSADMKDLGLEVFDDYAEAMAHIERTEGSDLDRTSMTADNRVLDRKRGAVQEFLEIYRERLLPELRDRAFADMKFDLWRELGETEQKPPILLGGDEITISLHPAFADLGVMPMVMKALQNPQTINARVAVGRGTGAEGQRDAKKEGGDSHGVLKTFEKAARDLESVQLNLFWNKQLEAEQHIRTLRGLYVSIEDGKQVLRGPDGQKVDGQKLKERVDELLKEGGFDPKKGPGGGGAAGGVEVQGMGQQPRTYPWRRNQGGLVRTPAQALEIARRAGILIPEDIRFVAVDAKWLKPDTFAEYMNRSFTRADERIGWDDMLSRFEDVAVKFSRDILSSDEAIVAVFSHEMHELNGLREIFNNRGGTITAAELHRLINPGIRGNLHDQAWDIADEYVNKLRNPTGPSGGGGGG